MPIVLIILISSFAALSADLKFPPLQKWELREKLLGADYALVEKASSHQTIVIKKIPAPLKEAEVESYLKKLASDKWKDGEVLDVKDLYWGNTVKGKLLKVKHLQKNLPHTTLVGAYPLKDAHYIIYFTKETLKFEKKDKEVSDILQSVKIN